MAIASMADYNAALKERLPMFHAGLSGDDIGRQNASSYGLVSLVMASQASGIVPTSADAGYPSLLPIASGKKRYMTKVEMFYSASEVAWLFDNLFVCGTYAFNANQALSAQPDFSARLPTGSYVGLSIYVEMVTAFTGNPTITVDYLDELGNAAQATVTLTAPGVNTWSRMSMSTPGVSKITNVACSVATAGTFNVAIKRKIAYLTMRNIGINRGQSSDVAPETPLSTGMAEIPDGCALELCYRSTSGNRNCDTLIELAHG